jgi:serine/threonine-protein kinase
MQICRALAAAHVNGVVHRDMKPENVFLQRTADGEEIVKIVDFGIAQLRSKDEAVVETKRRLTRTGMIFGTPEYMAPEQASGKHADLRADIYAVGIMMYEMFTGAVPFTGETFLGVLTKHLNEPAPPMNALYPDLTISSQLQAVIMRALEKDPRVRYQSMLEFAQAISGSPDATALGYRPTITSIAEHSISSLPHSPGSPTAQQFVPAAQDPMPNPSRAGETLASQGADPARAETQLGAETIAVSPTTRSRGGLAAAALAAALLASGAGLFLAKRGSSTTPTPEVNAPAVAKAALAPASSVAAAPGTNSQPAPSAESTKPAEATAVAPASAIRLDVSSDPTGATLSKNGFQVCDATPCEVLATPNETLEFEAAKGALKGSAKVLAQRDQKVTIKLAAAAAPAKHADTSATPRMCEVEVDGLKILRPCK